MMAQLSAEILVGMVVTLLAVLVLLHYFVAARSLISGAQSALSQMAASAASYQARLQAG